MSAPPSFADCVSGISPDIFNERDFRAIAQLVMDEVGITLPASKAMLVYSRFAPLIRKAGCTTFKRFIELMYNDAAVMAQGIAALTTNHTFFYRESHHFEHFVSQVRAKLVTKAKSGAPVRIWCAGCSSGEEAWTIAMSFLGPDRQQGLELLKKDVLLLASDIAPHALEKAIGATYPEKDIEAVPEPLRKAWVTTQNGVAKINPQVREFVRFRSLNLLKPWPMKGKFDIIFCRNVMIYFDNPTKERLVDRFADILLPEGVLYIGHSERVSGPALRKLEQTGPTLYERVAA